MKTIRIIFVITVSVLLTGNLTAQSKDRMFNLKDLRKLVGISSPKISPDGSRIAFIKSVPDWEKDKNKQEIDLVNIKEKSLRCLTFHRKDISKLAWSPDGNNLSFISEDSSTKKPQIYIMPMNGGDAVCLTNSKTGVSEYTWSPDGKKIAYVAQDTIPNPKEIKHHEDAFKVTDNNYMVRKVLQPWHLWIIPAGGKGKAKQLIKGSVSLCTDQETISPLVWSPDGKSIHLSILSGCLGRKFLAFNNFGNRYRRGRNENLN